MTRHTRTQSAVQQLIVDRSESKDEEEDLEKGKVGKKVIAVPSGVFPTGPSPQGESPRDIHASKKRKTRWTQLWNNRKSVMLAVILFFAGSGCLLLGLYSLIAPNASQYIGWWLVLPGIIAFLPGAYHCCYICCIVVGRDGYDLDKLPTFKR